MEYYSHILLPYYFLLFLRTFPLAPFCFPAGPVQTFTSIFSSWDMVSFRISWWNLKNYVKFWISLSHHCLQKKSRVEFSFQENPLPINTATVIFIDSEVTWHPRHPYSHSVLSTSKTRVNNNSNDHFIFSFGNWLCSAWKMKMSPRWAVILKVRHVDVVKIYLGDEKKGLCHFNLRKDKYLCIFVSKVYLTHDFSYL